MKEFFQILEQKITVFYQQLFIPSSNRKITQNFVQRVSKKRKPKEEAISPEPTVRFQ
jgi:hypothetical protein